MKIVGLHCTAVLLAAGCLGAALPAAAQDFTRINSRANPEHFVHIERARVEAGRIELAWWSAQWQLERMAGSQFVRVRNAWKEDHYLHNEGGSISTGPVKREGTASHWLVVPAGAAR